MIGWTRLDQKGGVSEGSVRPDSSFATMDSVLEDAYDEAPAETLGTQVGLGNGGGKPWRKEEKIRVNGMSWVIGVHFAQRI